MTSTGVSIGRRDPAGLSPTLNRARGFSLLELIVVMTVTLMLTGLMLPALVQVRENAHRVVCSSNLRQVGLATVIYTDDHSGELPPSTFALPGGNKQEMMVSHRGKLSENWEGLGWLWARVCLNAAEILYCPSHTGVHLFERYEEYYRMPGVPRIYTNYHYAGHLDWETGAKRRLDSGEGTVLATDGMRTKRDFNHKTGTNVLRGDNSVNWFDNGSLVRMLPSGDAETADAASTYTRIWGVIGGQ